MANRNEYMRKYMLDRYYRRRSEAIVQLGGCCVMCGVVDGLIFDHIDPSTKLYHIGGIFSGGSEKKVQTEIAKCQLLCEACNDGKTRVDLAALVLRGEDSPNAVLTEDAVRDIRTSESSIRDLALKYGVSGFSIRCARSGKTWSHVDVPIPTAFPPRTLKAVIHGTFSGYRKGCRCADCRAANAKRQSDWLARKKKSNASLS